MDLDITFYDFVIPADLVPFVAAGILAVILITGLIFKFILRRRDRTIGYLRDSLDGMRSEYQKAKEEARDESNERWEAERKLRKLEKEIEEGNGNLDREQEGELVARIDELLEKVDQLKIENEHLREQVPTT